MRRIGIIPSQTHSRLFSDYLFARGIENQVDPEPQGWGVWVLDDDHLEAAGAELNNFLANPDHPTYQQAAPAAESLRRKQEQKQTLRRKLYTDVRTSFNHPGNVRRAFTTAIIVLCVMTAMLTALGEPENPATQRLMMSQPILQEITHDGETYTVIMPIRDEMGRRDRRAELASILDRHEYWRLISPIFLHMSLLHLVFNMFWLKDFGTVIESRKSPLKLLLLILGAALFSNLAQFHLEGPRFGGFSGVNYALFGYIWMKGKFAPREQLLLHKNTIQIMIAWLLICMTGLVGPIANTAHLFGLIFGMACGYAPVFLARGRNRPSP